MELIFLISMFVIGVILLPVCSELDIFKKDGNRIAVVILSIIFIAIPVIATVIIPW